MPYRYVAYTVDKKVINGTLGVSEEAVAADVLENAGLRILSLKETRCRHIDEWLPSIFGPRPRDVALFSHQLALLLEKGNGFRASLRLCRDQTTNRGLKRALETILEDVESGMTFSKSLTKHPRLFPLSYCRMVEVGENTGRLEAVLRRLATNIEHSIAVQKKLRSAAAYPVFVLIFGLATVTVLVTAALPPLINLFSEYEAALPFPTQLVLSFRDFMVGYGAYLAGAAVLLGSVAVWRHDKPFVQRWREKILLKVPVISRLSLYNSLNDFSRTMSMLLSAGLPMAEVVNLARRSVHSLRLGRTLDEVPVSLFQGERLSESLKKSGLFPGLVVQLIATGEETNTLDASFESVAEHYESEFNETLTMFTSIVGPALLLLVGLVVGFITIAVIMPINSIYQVLE